MPTQSDWRSIDNNMKPILTQSDIANDNDSLSSNGEDISFDLNELAQNAIAEKNAVDNNEDNAEANAEESTPDNVPEVENPLPDDLFPTLSAEDEHVKMVLLSRRKENGTIKKRRDLLFSFVFGTKNAHIKTFFHHSLHDNTALLNLHEDLMKCRARKHDTKKQFIGLSLFTFWMMLKKSDESKEADPNIRNTRKDSEPSQIQNLRAFIKPVNSRFEFDAVNGTDKKQRNILAQKNSGDFIQDEFVRNNPDWRNLILSSPCPLCNHNCLVPHERDEDLLDEIQAMKSSWQEANTKFHLMPPSQQNKSKKPKQPTYPKQHLICLCLVNRCRDFSSGKGCLNCESSVKSGMKLSYNPQTDNSNCKMCQCSCTAYFKRIEWNKLKSQVEVDKREKARETKEEAMKAAAGKL